MTEVMVTNDKYPCCGHQARIARFDRNRPILLRTCNKCGAEYKLTRRKGKTTNGVRFDELSWRRTD